MKRDKEVAPASTPFRKGPANVIFATVLRPPCPRPALTSNLSYLPSHTYQVTNIAKELQNPSL